MAQIYVFNLKGKIDAAIEEFFKQIDSYLRDKPAKILEKKIPDAQIQTLYSSMSLQGWEMTVEPEWKLGFSKANLSIKILWSKSGERQTEKQFDEAFKSLYEYMQSNNF